MKPLSTHSTHQPYLPVEGETVWMDARQIGSVFGWERQKTAHVMQRLFLCRDNGTPCESAINQGMAAWRVASGRKRQAWLWRADVIVPMLESVGIHPLPPAYQVAFHHIVKAVRKLNLATFLQEQGREEDAYNATLSAAVILVCANGGKRGEESLSILKAIDFYMAHADISPALRETILGVSNIQAYDIMSETDRQLIDLHTDKPVDAQRTRRL